MYISEELRNPLMLLDTHLHFLNLTSIPVAKKKSKQGVLVFLCSI